MPVRMKQLILFLSILLFYPLLFYLVILYAHGPISGSHDPSGSHRVGRAIEAVVIGFICSLVFMFSSMLWARKLSAAVIDACVANVSSIMFAFLLLAGLGFSL